MMCNTANFSNDPIPSKYSVAETDTDAVKL